MYKSLPCKPIISASTMPNRAEKLIAAIYAEPGSALAGTPFRVQSRRNFEGRKRILSQQCLHTSGDLVGNGFAGLRALIKV